MKSRLGLEFWQILLLYLIPPLLICLAFAWRAVHRATNHPDGNPPAHKRKKRARP